MTIEPSSDSVTIWGYVDSDDFQLVFTVRLDLEGGPIKFKRSYHGHDFGEALEMLGHTIDTLRVADLAQSNPQLDI